MLKVFCVIREVEKTLKIASKILSVQEIDLISEKAGLSET